MTSSEGGLVTSQREVARQLGVSHTALQKAVQAGRIAPRPIGGWNVEAVRAQMAATSDPARRMVQPIARPERPTNGQSAAPVPEPLPTSSAGNSGFHNARTANEVLKAQERRLRLDERRGMLIDKNKALLLVHRLAKEEREAILAWPARVAAEMGAEMGVDPHRLQIWMESRLRQHLIERSGVRVQVN